MLRRHTWLFIVLILALITRGYQLQARFLYSHDNDLASWIVKDIVVDRHLRLIGQLTSSPGIFIGPLFYYLLIPFYLAARMDPVGSLAFSLLVGLATVTSIYWVLNMLFRRQTGSIAALLYSVSFAVSQSEREVVPTTPVFFWSVWFFYAVSRLYSGHKSALYILAVLFALVWHLNLALILLVPVIFPGIFIHRRSYRIRDLILSLVVFVILSAPLLLFEYRHGFIQSRSLVSSLATIGTKSGKVTQKFSRVALYAARNSTAIFFPRADGASLSVYLLPALCLIVIALLALKKVIPSFTPLIIFAWISLYLLFFAAHPIILSEYYLNGLNILWITSVALFLSFLSRLPKTRLLTAIILGLYLGYHLNVFLTSPINKSGYLEKKALVQAIALDSRLHGYPCVAVSYMTNPGYELGYRYFFYLAGLHVNQPKSGSPVYTVVFPHPRANRLDNTFGALGLIMPDYSKYSASEVKTSCSGDNANLTDPMFGFTK